MKKLLSLLAFSLPLVLIAQDSTTTGIAFEHLPNWAAAKEKARQENKFIFVDCFATWCGPCKAMDKNVYPLDSVGKFFSDHYISIKVQMDSTKTDNEHIKSWYADAHSIMFEYKISAFPSFLYFTPDGQLVHKALGYQIPQNFLSLARNALDPNKQYYTLKDAFDKGKVNFTDMPDLANTARILNDQAFASAVGKSYINGYLLKRPEDEVYTAKNLRFLFNYTTSSADESFKFFYRNADRIDQVMKDSNFSRSLVEFYVEKDEINPRLYKDNKPISDTPDWTAIQRNIKNKYGQEFAERLVLWAKIKWFSRRQDWPAYCKSVIMKVEKYGPYRNFGPYAPWPINLRWNSAAWDLFLHCSDSSDLKKALEWSAKALAEPKPENGFFDTYANILYKLGRDTEAITYEEKAVNMNPKDKDISDNLEKMKKGEPTWPTK